MGAIDFELMSLDELWSLHERLAELLAERLRSEKAALEARLRKLNQAEVAPKIERPRRPYPVVVPKYRNPDDASETWSGRKPRDVSWSAMAWESPSNRTSRRRRRMRHTRSNFREARKEPQ